MAQTSQNFRFCFIKRAHHRILLIGLWKKLPNDCPCAHNTLHLHSLQTILDLRLAKAFTMGIDYFRKYIVKLKNLYHFCSILNIKYHIQNVLDLHKFYYWDFNYCKEIIELLKVVVCIPYHMLVPSRDLWARHTFVKYKNNSNID